MMFKYVDILCQLPLYMYPKTHCRASHHIYFEPDYLLQNVRKLRRYYNMFESFCFAIYLAKSIFLSFNEVWRKDLVMHTMRLNGFILLVLFVTPA